jgi:hypothetical protein
LINRIVKTVAHNWHTGKVPQRSFRSDREHLLDIPQVHLWPTSSVFTIQVAIGKHYAVKQD